MTPVVIIIIGIVLAACLMAMLIILWSDVRVEGDDFDEPQFH